MSPVKCCSFIAECGFVFPIINTSRQGYITEGCDMGPHKLLLDQHTGRVQQTNNHTSAAEKMCFFEILNSEFLLLSSHDEIKFGVIRTT